MMPRNDLRRILLPIALLALVLLLLVAQYLFIPQVPKGSAASGKYKRGDYAGAEKQFRDLAQADQEDSVATHNLAKSLYKQDKYAEAEELLKTWEKKRKNSADMLYDLGNIAYQKLDYPKAIEHYKQALILDPTDQDAKANLELAYRKQNEKKPPQNKPEDKPRDQKNEDNKQGNEDYRNILNALDQKEALDRQNKQGNPDKNKGKWW